MGLRSAIGRKSSLTLHFSDARDPAVRVAVADRLARRRGHAGQAGVRPRVARHYQWSLTPLIFYFS